MEQTGLQVELDLKVERLQPLSDAVLRLIQISDSHLFAQKRRCLLGLNTHKSLQALLQAVKEREQDRGVDVLLATGDIAQDGRVSAYRQFLRLVSPLQWPLVWIQGNHDLTHAMRSVPKPHPWLSPCILEMGGWRIILLNSAIEYQITGTLTSVQLDFLQQALVGTDKFILIAMHHPPCPVGSAWLDQQQISNADAFWRVLRGQSQVRGIVCGHVHHEFHALIEGVSVWSTPSTCVQFKPSSAQFGLDELGPGYRRLDMYPDGRISTSVERIAALPGVVKGATGY